MNKAQFSVALPGREGPAEETVRSVDDNANDFDLRRLWATVWRGKWIILLALVLGVGMAGLNLTRAVPRYTAVADVRLISEGERIAEFEGVVSGISTSGATLYTELLVLTSERLLRRVVEALRLTEDPEFVPVSAIAEADAEPGWLGRALAYPAEALQQARALVTPAVADDPRSAAPAASFPAVGRDASEPVLQAIGALRSRVAVVHQDGTYVLSIKVVTRSPEKSAAIANAIAEHYVERQIEAKYDATRQATLWLSDQVVKLKTSLEEAESQIESFMAAAPLVNDSAMRATAARAEDLRVKLRELVLRAESARDRLAHLDTLRGIDDYSAIAEQLQDPLLAQLARDIAGAGPSAAAADTRGVVERFDDALAQRRRELADQITTFERQVPFVEKAIAEAEERLEARGAELVGLRQLQREAEATRTLYEHFLARMKETSSRQGVHTADSEVLSWASPPKVPSSPQKAATLARATMLSLALGIGIVLLLEYMNRRFRTPSELEEATGAPVFAVVPTAPERSPLLYVAKRPASAVAEAVRSLRTSVQLSSIDRAPQVLMITSSVPGEGKSTTLLMLAEITAQMGKRTLVIESDIRRPSFRREMGLEGARRRSRKDADTARPGLLTALRGEAPVEDAVFRHEDLGFDVLFSEQTRVNAADIFSSERFASFINEMRDQYDAIFLDTPPVLLVPDARVIAPLCDAIVYVVRWKSTSRDQVNSGLKLLAEAQTHVTGLALTRANPRKLARYGYEGYGSPYYAAGRVYYTN